MITIDSIKITENVSLIILYSAPSNINFISEVFERLSASDVNVDMISQSPPIGSKTPLSFTITDNDLTTALIVISEFRALYPEIKPSISSDNCKIAIIDEDMRYSPGVAADIFKVVSKVGADIRLITTSEVDISILIPKSDYISTYNSIVEFYK